MRRRRASPLGVGFWVRGCEILKLGLRRKLRSEGIIDWGCIGIFGVVYCRVKIHTTVLSLEAPLLVGC